MLGRAVLSDVACAGCRILCTVAGRALRRPGPVRRSARAAALAVLAPVRCRSIKWAILCFVALNATGTALAETSLHHYAETHIPSLFAKDRTPKRPTMAQTFEILAEGLNRNFLWTRSGPDSDNSFAIAAESRYFPHKNDFALWISRQENALARKPRMSCWEVFMTMAEIAGHVTKADLVSLHARASTQAERIYQRTDIQADFSNAAERRAMHGYYQTIGEFLGLTASNNVFSHAEPKRNGSASGTFVTAHAPKRGDFVYLDLVDHPMWVDHIVYVVEPSKRAEHAVVLSHGRETGLVRTTLGAAFKKSFTGSHHRLRTSPAKLR